MSVFQQKVIETPYGTAIQDTSPEAIKAWHDVVNGATIYKYGTLERSNLANSQFWSLENPLLTSNYVNSMGIPTENMAGTSFVITGQAIPGANFITRIAPPVGDNLGGAIEIVFEEYNVHINSFYMP